MDFYRRVRPWGFWGPVLKKVLAEDPGFKRNKDFFRDMFNIAVGIVWQVSLVALPLVHRDQGVPRLLRTGASTESIPGVF
jgi:hypothetical protein